MCLCCVRCLCQIPCFIGHSTIASPFSNIYLFSIALSTIEHPLFVISLEHVHDHFALILICMVDLYILVLKGV